MSYRFVEHTADLAFEVRAATLNELFEDALRASCDAMTDRGAVAASERCSIELEADDLELLMVDWLEEALYRFEVERLILADARAEVRHGAGGARIEAVASGETYDPERHEIKVLLKAVTYHGLAVRERDDGWYARVVLDI